MTLYEYGWIAWVWRAFIAVGLAAGGFLLIAGARDGAPGLILTGLPLVVPSLYFGVVLATRIDEAGSDLLVSTLLFWRRRVARDRIRPGIVRTHAQSNSGPIYAPRSFVPVRGGLAIYVDLLATIPDKRRFHEALRLARP